MKPSYTKTSEASTATSSGVSVDELKIQLGIYDDTSEDTFLGSLLLAGEQAASEYIGTPIGETQIVDSYARFFDRLEVSARYVPDGAVFVLTYMDEDNTVQTIPSSSYTVDLSGERPAIVKLSTATFPTEVSSYSRYPVSITYVAGLGTGPISEQLAQAILMFGIEMYNNRGISTDRKRTELPLSGQRLLSPFREVVL